MNSSLAPLVLTANSAPHTISLALPLLWCALLLSVSMQSSCSKPPLSRDGFDVAARQAWHATRLTTLAAQDGWLTLVGLDFLDSGAQSFGSAPNCALRYLHASAPQIGVFTREDDRVTFTASVGVSVTGDGAPITECVLLADGAPATTPETKPVTTAVTNAVTNAVTTVRELRNGPLTITLVRRNGNLALRVKDNDSAIRRDFAGIALFPFDESLVVEAAVEPAPVGGEIAITNVAGFVEQEAIAATLRFQLHGKTHTLTAMAGSQDRLFVVFGDDTNGATSYGGGRFLDIAPARDGRTMIDFNRAYNPPCCFTAFATCPLPPRENVLLLPIHAGERAPQNDEHAHDHASPAQ